MAAGNGKLMEHLGVPYIDCRSVGTIIHMAIDGKYMGHIVISDVVKPHAKQAVRDPANFCIFSRGRVSPC